jgi:hypothetical protein
MSICNIVKNCIGIIFIDIGAPMDRAHRSQPKLAVYAKEGQEAKEASKRSGVYRNHASATDILRCAGNIMNK